MCKPHRERPLSTPSPRLDQSTTPIIWVENSDEAFKIVDEEYKSLYWPSGVANLDLALPMQAQPGAVANFGTITLRKVPSYRIRVSTQGECGKGETWLQTFGSPALVGKSFSGFDCDKDSMLRGLQPGKYLLAAWSEKHWAQTEFEIIDRNIPVKLTISPGRQVEGRVIAPEGVPIASLGVIGIGTDPGRSILGYKAPWTTNGTR